MGRTKKVIDYKELIQQYLDKKPFEPYKQTRAEVMNYAELITKDLDKQFGKEYKFSLNIGAETMSPPNQVSWHVTKLTGAK